MKLALDCNNGLGYEFRVLLPPPIRSKMAIIIREQDLNQTLFVREENGISIWATDAMELHVETINNQTAETNIHIKARKQDPQLQCQFCDKRFPNNFELNVHESNEHTKEEQLKCKICHRIFKEAQNLKWHKKLHERQQTYRCETCFQVFLRHCKYEEHRRKVHFN